MVWPLPYPITSNHQNGVQRVTGVEEGWGRVQGRAGEWVQGEGWGVGAWSDEDLARRGSILLLCGHDTLLVGPHHLGAAVLQGEEG